MTAKPYEPNMVLANETFDVIGSRPIRHDGADKVTGRAQYGADFDTVQAKYGEYENHSLVANVLLVGGGVALAAGGALWFMSTSTESVAVVLGPDRLLLRGRF